MNQKRIVIDGKVYNSVDEMPGDVRQRYLEAMRKLDQNNNGRPDMLENANAFFEDKDKDGVPDAFDGLRSLANVDTTTKIITDGKEYSGMDDLPPEVRAKLTQALGKLDANQNGIPDFLETGAAAQNQGSIAPSASIGMGTPPQTQSKPFFAPQTSSAIEPEPASSGWMIALAGLLLLLLCAAAMFAAWYFFLR